MLDRICDRPKITSIFLFFKTLVWFGFWASTRADFHHDGVMLKPALDVAEGQMPYRDTFSQYGVLTVLLQSAAVYLFSGKVIVLRWLTVVFYSGISVLLFLISRKILRPAFIWIPLLLFYTQPPFYIDVFYPWCSVYSLFSLLLICYCLMRVIEQSASNCTYIWFLIGFCSMIPFGFRQPYGLVVPAVGLITLILHWKYQESLFSTVKRALFFSVGSIVFATLLTAWLYVNGALNDYFLQQFVLASRFAEMMKTVPGTPNLLHDGIFRDPFWGVLFCLVIIWCLFVCYKLITKNDSHSLNWTVLPVSILAVISLNEYYPLGDGNHCYWGGTPGFIVFALVMQMLWDIKRWNLFFRFAAILLLCLPLCRCGLRAMGYGFHFSNKLEVGQVQRVVGTGPFAGMYEHSNKIQFIQKMTEMINSIPDDYKSRQVINMTREVSFLLLFENHSNWHPMYYPWNNGPYPNYYKDREALLKTGEPIVFCCVEHLPEITPFGYHTWKEIDGYVVAICPKDSSKQ